MKTGENISCVRGQLLNSTQPINIECVCLIVYHSFSSLSIGYYNMVNECYVHGCQSNYKNMDVEYKYANENLRN